MKTILIVASMTLISSFSYGKGKGAHAHGVGELNIGIEEKKVHIEIKTPMTDVVGFEYKPKSKKEMAKVKKAWENIMMGKFVSVDGGSCTSKIEVEGLLKGSDNHHDDHKKKHDDDDDHHHDDHKKKHDDDDHDDHKHKEGEHHSDVEISVAISCDKSIRGKKLRLELKKVVPGLHKIEQQVIGGAKAHGGLVKVKDVMTFDL